MKEKKKVPEIRFPGFTDEWKPCKFADGVSEVGDGLHGTPTYSDNGCVYFINGNNLVDGKIIIDSKTKTVNENQQSLADKSLDDTTILMSINGTIGNLAYYSGEKLMLGKSVAYIKVSKFDKAFIYTYLQVTSVKRYFTDNLTGTTIKNLGLESIRKMNLIMPQEVAEEKSIGLFFSNIDNIITLRQRELDKLKEFKKGMLQKMFPKKGEKVPEIRFPGFTDDWEQRKLGDLGSVSMCKRIFKDQTQVDGEIPFYKIGTFGGEADAYISKKLFDEYKKIYPYPEKGDILISASGSIGRTVEYNGENAYYQDSNIVWLKHNELIANSFLKQFYAIVHWDGIEGSTIKRLYNDNILKTEIKLPTIDEQKQIGKFFDGLDTLITLHQRELEELKKFKKGMLQKMFI